jgi:tetratricopeptide (TPR) repeat protein
MKTSRFLLRVASFCILSFSILPWSAAQQDGQPGQNPGGGGDKGGTAPPNQDTKRQPAIMPSQQQTRNEPKPSNIFISGTVMMEDGSAPPFGTSIQLDCAGPSTKQADVNPNGNFSFQVGEKNRWAFFSPDASQSIDADQNDIFPPDSFAASEMTQMMGMAGAPRLIGCDVKAQLSGYKSSVLRLNAEPATGQNDIGSIVLYPMERVKGNAISGTSLLAPKPARKLLERALKALQKNKFEEAEPLLNKAVQVYPKYAEAWLTLGGLQQKTKRYEEARSSYSRAVEADGLYVGPLVRLTQIAMMEKNWQQAADLSNQALDLDPVSFPEAYYMNALANFNLDRLEIAERRAIQEQRLDQEHRFPRVHLILADIFAKRNDWTESSRQLQTYLKVAPNAPDTDFIRTQLREREKLPKSGSGTR